MFVNMSKFYVCRCFYTRNIFLKKYNIHVEYPDRETFISTYSKILNDIGISTQEEKENIVSEIEKEILRRKNIGQDFLNRKQMIRENYFRKHPSIFTLKERFLAPEFLSLVDYCKQSDATFEDICDQVTETQVPRAYAFPVFTEEFCKLFLEEIQHFENSDCPKGRPNTMNRYGVLLDELGFDDFMTELRTSYLQPITKLLFPDWGGGDLDSHKAFIVQYKEQEDKDLSYHFDNAEVTINVPLSPIDSYTGGKLFFGPMRTEVSNTSHMIEYDHQLAMGLLHRGQHKHGARPITSGERYNLIIWMRSSKVRNKLCPMCDREPHLVETVGFGDGFTKYNQQMVNVCAVE